MLRVQEIIVFKTPTQHKKSAAEGGQLLRLFFLFFRLLYNHFLDFQNKKYRYWVYLMEHIFFEVQLCLKISIFKEKPVFDILFILPSVGGLHLTIICKTAERHLGCQASEKHLRCIWHASQKHLGDIWEPCRNCIRASCGPRAPYITFLQASD